MAQGASVPEQPSIHWPVRLPDRTLDEPSAMRPIQRSGGRKRARPRRAGIDQGQCIAIAHSTATARTLTTFARDS